jgi:hypothetical protein
LNEIELDTNGDSEVERVKRVKKNLNFEEKVEIERDSDKVEVNDKIDETPKEMIEKEVEPEQLLRSDEEKEEVEEQKDENENAEAEVEHDSEQGKHLLNFYKYIFKWS